MQSEALQSISFRHEFGSLVAHLTRRFGTVNLELIEDSVQQSLTKAVEVWPRSEIPDNPSAWLYKVSYHNLVSRLLAEAHLVSDDSVSEMEAQINQEAQYAGLKNELDSSLLQMLFVACHPDIPLESQLIFTLKSLCGFSINELSERLFISTENSYKRFNRAKKILKQRSITFETLGTQELQQRLPDVRKVLYCLFSEGYFSSNENELIRAELCEEAIYLTSKLCSHPHCAEPETLALCALMLLHYSTLNMRKNAVKELPMFKLKDKSTKDMQAMAKGLDYLAASATGDSISRFHIEANIAAEYTIAPDFDAVNWDNIISSYALLRRIEPENPLYILNQSVALTQAGKSALAWEQLYSSDFPNWLTKSHIYHAVLAWVHLHEYNNREAKNHACLAVQLAPTKLVEEKLISRLRQCLDLR